MKFTKRPITIEATQWHKNGDHPQDDVFRPYEDTGKIPEGPREGAVVRYYRHPNVPGTDFCAYCKTMFHDHGWIDTAEGGHIVCPGDWIITGIKGERYPCKPDIFARTYQPEKTQSSAGVDLIARERERQCWKEGWTPEHDDTHTKGELAMAAVCYAALAAFTQCKHLEGMPSEMFPPKTEIVWWPWADEWWKPSDNPIRNLEKAGALIAAEIDRLKRKQAAQ